MRVLAHCCCGPCAIYPLEALESEGHQVTGFWYNPNIHPYKEYQRRLEAFSQLAEARNLPVIWRDQYQLERHLQAVLANEAAERCGSCYELRLRQAAQMARRSWFDAFTTSLLVSPYQQHELLRDLGEKVGREEGIPFLYRDFRPGFRAGRQAAQQLGLYLQPYCGCVLSERDRYWRKDRERR
ncbi:MAG: epoxyqueuosine reductase QueH [Bacillota bacterium]